MEKEQERQREGTTYYLELNDEGHATYPKENLLQVVVGDKIIFHINAGSPIGKKAYMRVNMPQMGEDRLYHKGATAMRSLRKRPSMKLLTAEELGLQRIEPQARAFGGGVEFEVQFIYPGSFFYQVEYFDDKLNLYNFTHPDWIVVHPRFVTRHGEITAESIVMQTVLGRCLGKISNWSAVLGAQAKLGYNAIHMTPIQKYGSSNSMYSLRDQNSIDDCYMEDTSTPADERIQLVKQTVEDIREKHDLLCFVDIVLNHTADNSDWLVEHPDGAYNLYNCPYLKVAWEFERFLIDFSNAYAHGKVPECPAAPYVGNEGDLNAVITALGNRLKGLPLGDYFMYNREAIKGKFDEFMKTSHEVNLDEAKAERSNIVDYIIKHSFGYGAKPRGVDVDMSKVGAMMLAKSAKGKGNPAGMWKELEGHLNACEGVWRKKYEDYMKEALECLRGGIRYEKITLRSNKITPDNPLIKRYFTEIKGGASTRDKDEFIMAHNGWTTETTDFGSPLSFAYLRRQIVIWDDSIKLYYGAKREDSPYIWSHMEKYVGAMATIFQGMRIDNCHSTPIHVLEYFVNYARAVNPNLFVFAELFSGNSEVDAVYAKRIALNALIRESMYVGRAEDLQHLIKRASGDQDYALGDTNKEYYLPDGRKICMLCSSKPRDLLYDITHDNPSAMDKWNPIAILPVCSALAMTNGTVGTTRGVDEFVPQNLSVVSEKRVYACPPDIVLPGEAEEAKTVLAPAPAEDPEVEFVYKSKCDRVCVLGNFNGWKIDANQLQSAGDGRWTTKVRIAPGTYHYKFFVNGKDWLLGDGPTEKDAGGNVNNVVVVTAAGASSPSVRSGREMLVFDDLRAVRKVTNEVHRFLGLHRTNIRFSIHGDVLVIKRTIEDAKSGEDSAYILITRTTFNKDNGGCAPEAMNLSLSLPGKLSRVLLTCNLFVDQENIRRFGQDSRVVNGIKGQLFFHTLDSGLKHFVKVRAQEDFDYLDFFKMPSSFCLILTTKLTSKQAKIASDIAAMEEPPVEDLTAGGINHLLFRCNTEEREFTNNGRGVYEFGALVPKYAGIAGLMYEFSKCKSDPNACTGIFDNIKLGNWLIDYHLKRASEMPELKSTLDWMMKYLAPIKELAPSVKPKLFVQVVSKLYHAIWASILRAAPPIFKSDVFCATLMLSAYEFLGYLPTSAFRQFKETVSAGLPHFATQFMRCWGRDTMISLRGLLLIPKRFKEARDVLLMFATVSRHGLIPNLHDQGNNTRFNSRDATWFFMEAVQDYVKHDTEHGASIFQEQVQMQFLDSNMEEHHKKLKAGQKLVLSFADIIQNLMQSHASGINYVEWNAGPKIDEHMTKEGFNVRIGLDLNTGFIHGGNKFNNSTWMDKLGSSSKAKNKGVPATPRDGADVEIIGLLRSAVRFLDQMHAQGLYPYEGVTVNDGKTGSLTYKQWGELIDANFEKFFWVPSDKAELGSHVINPKLIQRAGIYKDIVGCSDPASDYRFRPNFAIAMAVAPEMFNKEHAQCALDLAENELIDRGCVGMKTLHPKDPQYRPKYINNDDGTDYSIAQGFSYHQGPEWVWPIGYFMRALLIFGKRESMDELEQKMMRLLEPHRKHLLSSPWISLPEITDAHGQENPFGCPAQAWSIATIMDAVYDFNKLLTTAEHCIVSASFFASFVLETGVQQQLTEHSNNNFIIKCFCPTRVFTCTV